MLAEISLPAFDLGNVLTGSGFGALVWYLVARQGPRQQAEWQKELSDSRTEFARMLNDARRDFSTILAEEREYRAKITNLVLVMLSAAMTSPAIRDHPEVKAAVQEFSKESGIRKAR